MDRWPRIPLAGVLLAAALSGPAAAQAPAVQVKEAKPGLFQQATITAAAATATAQARFPTGVIKSGELEREGGKLIYSFDIQLPGVKGIEEIHIDARSGAVLTTEHEGPAPPKPVKRPPLS